MLLTAEILAKVYYAALKEATRSPMLRRICARILLDEEAHVRFQAERLAILRRARKPMAMGITNLLHRMLYFGACLVVWRNHGKAIRQGGMDFGVYWRRSWEEFRTAAKIMAPNSYPDMPGSG